MHTRVCPDCGEEFRPEIVRCSDCGALLRDRLEDDLTEVADGTGLDGSAPGATASAPVEIRRRSLYSSNRIREIQPLAERLGSSGTPFWVESAGDSWTVLVAEADEEHGRAILAEVLGAPESPSPAFDPEAGYAACPACGHALESRAVECPECGLAVGAAPEEGEDA
jgi:predicted RNA-binding Zn-ribbon protein involved in translation (DUF1610 family)